MTAKKKAAELDKTASTQKSVPSKGAAQSQQAPQSFEQSIHRLGEIVERLEGGELPLEESLALFEEGMRLSRASQSVLNAAEKRVEELLRFDERGEPVVKALPLDDEEPEDDED